MPDSYVATVTCPKCRAPLPSEVLNTTKPIACPSCFTPIIAAVFPALVRPLEKGQAGEAIVVDGDAGCFYHPRKKAVIACELCGRFLCSLCDVALGGQHVCPTCLEAGKRKDKIKNIQNSRFLYDQLALALAFYPLLMWPFTIITAPVTLYVSIRYWKAPLSLLHRNRIRFVIAMLVACLQLAGWTFFIVSIFTK